MFLKYVLSQEAGELAVGNGSREEPQSNALLRTTLRLYLTLYLPASFCDVYDLLGIGLECTGSWGTALRGGMIT
jgi:hypothetical protein